MVAAREVPSVKRLDPKGTVVVVVDIQERLAAAMPGPRLADVVRATQILVEAAPLRVRDLVGRYLDVHVAADGVCSRRDDHRELGLRLCERSGAILTTAESVVFDWLERAGSDVFKQVAKLVR
jgi:hypothetical protein